MCPLWPSLLSLRGRREGWRLRLLEVHFHTSLFPGRLPLHVQQGNDSHPLLLKSGKHLTRATFYLQTRRTFSEYGMSDTKWITPNSHSQPYLSTHRQRWEEISFASGIEIFPTRWATLKSETGKEYQNTTKPPQNSTRCQDKLFIHLYSPLTNIC